MVTFDSSFSTVKGSPWVLICYPAAAIPAWLCESGLLSAMDEANRSHLSPRHSVSSQRAPKIKSTKADLYSRGGKGLFLYCPLPIVWMLEVKTIQHSCFEQISSCVRQSERGSMGAGARRGNILQLLLLGNDSDEQQLRTTMEHKYAYVCKVPYLRLVSI